MMVRKIQRIVIILGLVFLLGMALKSILLIRPIRVWSDQKCTVSTPAARISADQKNISHITRKEFIYLVQAESCLPSYLKKPELLGNSSACRCDVLVLSYKNKCEEATNSDHVQYIYAPNTTWASGRNLLYRTSRARKVDYHYYIFADDDFTVEYNPTVNKSARKQPELRTFENFLLDIEPAVGFVNYLTHHPASLIRALRQHCHNKPDMSLLPLVHFDPILNGFHRDAISHLLPYSEEFDRTCWWHSHRLVSIGIEVKFRGQAVMYPGITVSNPSHRPYPTNTSDELQVIRNAIEREKHRVPMQYRYHHFTLLLFTFQPYHYSWGLSPTTCTDIVPHRPIVPYVHFQEFPMHNYNSLERFFNITAVMPVFYDWIRRARSS